MPQELRIRSDDRVALVGRTGSGKTYAARRLCNNAKRLMVLDPKQRIDATEWRCIPWDREARRLLQNREPVRTLIRAPLTMKPWEFWEDIYRLAMSYGNVLVYTDEVYLVLPPGGVASPAMRACWTAGREIGVGSYAAMQRPSRVPLEVISEAEHIFMFRLTLADDRKRMVDNGLGDAAMQMIKDRHGLFYMHYLMDNPIYFPSLPEPVRSAGSAPLQSARRVREAA